MPLALIESLDNEGRGIARVDGKTIFIEGALPGEIVEYASFRRKPSFELATATRIVRASSQRVEPGCPHFGVCGGCSMQHANLALQTAAKQRVLEDALWHIGHLRAEQIYPPIAGSGWGYRHRARLSIRYVAKKNAVLVGFHEKKSSFVAVMDSCAVLPPRVSALLPPLQALMQAMSIRDRLPQVELAAGDTQVALVLRVMAPLSSDDEEHLRRFADTHGVVWYLQPKGPDTVALFHPLDASGLSYALPDFGLELCFAPTEFTQVNPHVNRMLVRRAMSLLQPTPGERVADLFCGLGNFSLPIAKSGAQVLGIEGSEPLVLRARDNALRNGLGGHCAFAVANLFDEKEVAATFHADQFDKLLIDPPRDGAQTLISGLPTKAGPWRIVYISCNAATLARDAAILVTQKGYALRGAGVACMFPHTSHVESIALFERG
jgi:23S rRNA (uracil1939-C5)-methyltransferase